MRYYFALHRTIMWPQKENLRVILIAGGERNMKKQQVEYKVNLIGETELSEWSDEIVELLVEVFAEKSVSFLRVGFCGTARVFVRTAT